MTFRRSFSTTAQYGLLARFGETALRDRQSHQVQQMTTSALVFMVAVWTVVGGMAAYCYVKMLASKRRFGSDDESEASKGDSHEGLR